MAVEPENRPNVGGSNADIRDVRKELRERITQALSESSGVLDMSNIPIGTLPTSITALQSKRKPGKELKARRKTPGSEGIADDDDDEDRKVEPEEDAVTTVKAVNCCLKEFPIILKALSDQLTRLDLSQNPMGVLSPSMGSLAALKVLRMRDCNLSSLGPGIKNLTKLRDLDISHNKFQTFPVELFDIGKNLQMLDASYNGIVALPADFGDHMSALEVLRLDHNLLKKVVQSCSKLFRLRKCDISNNTGMNQGLIDAASDGSLQLKLATGQLQEDGPPRLAHVLDAKDTMIRRQKLDPSLFLTTDLTDENMETWYTTTYAVICPSKHSGIRIRDINRDGSVPTFVIAAIEEDSDAAHSGLQVGDYIVQVNDQPLLHKSQILGAHSLEILIRRKPEIVKVERVDRDQSWGITLKLQDQWPAIKEVKPDSPASAAGIEENRLLTHINHQCTKGLRLPELVGMLRKESRLTLVLGFVTLTD
eukprot:Clim_evm7s146 gene=Clim_evmTU7s146